MCPRPAHLSAAHTRRSVATEDSACDRWAPLARWRVPPVASGQPCRSARRSCRGQAGAPPAAWHALRAAAAHPQRRQVAPRRAVSAPCHRAGAPGAPMLRHRRSPPADRTTARESRAGLTHCDGGKSHPPKGTTQPHQCKGQRSGKGTLFLVRALWVRLGIRLQQVMPAIPPCAGTRSQPTDRHIVPLRCCILLLYKARELWAQDFEFISLIWVELRGFEPRTSCMPFLAEPSGGVEVGRGLALQSGLAVRLRPAASEAVCVRSHLVSHWSLGTSSQDMRLCANRIGIALMSVGTGQAPRVSLKGRTGGWPSSNCEHGLRHHDRNRNRLAATVSRTWRPPRSGW
jgi:hypothetical protein